MSFLLGNKLVAKVHADIPLYGVASADVELDGAGVLSGRQTLTIGDLAMSGTIADGGVSAGRGIYHWIAGAAGWRTTIPARGYGASQVRRSSVLRDAAEACGESLSYGLPDVLLGLPGNNGYLRPAGPAWDVFMGASEAGRGLPWYVDTMGVTQVAERASLAASSDGVIEGIWPDEGRLVVVPSGERIAGYMPGRVLGGAVIKHLTIDAAPNEPIRLTLWTRDPQGQSHDVREQLDRLFAQNASNMRFHGRYRYRVKSRNGTLYGLEPVDPALGLPRLDNRDLRFGIPGFDATLQSDPGEEVTITLPIVLVEFLDGLPSEAVISGYHRLAASNGEKPVEVSLDANQVKLGGAAKYVARQDDLVNSGALRLEVLGSAMILAYTDQDSNVKTWTITASNGGGPVAWVVVPSPLGDAVGVRGRIDAPTQFKVKA